VRYGRERLQERSQETSAAVTASVGDDDLA
jgi:hypothetical protein